VIMTTRLPTIKAPAKKAIRATLPRLAGNLPRVIQYWLSKYRWNPTRRTRMARPMKVAPNGFPTLPRRALEPSASVERDRSSLALAVSIWKCSSRGFRAAAGVEDSWLIVLLRRKSWVTAIPIEAKAREVRSQARKVRSIRIY
jgi:hypothetical protein